MRDLTLMLASMITIIGTTAIAPSLPEMNDFFGGVTNGQYWVLMSLTIPALSAGLFGPFIGLVIDRYGRKRVFVTALVIYGLSGTSGFFLSSLPIILVSRFILGISVAALTTCATTLISDYSHRSKTAISMGRQSLFMALGNVSFVSLSGILAEFNWRWPFMIYAIAFLILPSAILLITEPKLKSNEVEESLNTKKEKLRMGPMTFICILGFINMVVYFMIPVHLPFYVQSLAGSNSVTVGFLLALVGLSWGIASSQYSRLKKGLTLERIAMLALLLIATGYFLLSTATNYYIVIVALVLVGGGVGTTLPNLNAWLLSIVPTSVKGRALGTLFFFIFLGQFFSPAITQPLTTLVGISQSYLIAGMLLLLTTFTCGLYEYKQKRRNKLKMHNGLEQRKSSREKTL